MKIDKIKNKKIAKALAIIALVGTLSACQSSNASTGGKTATTATQSTSSSSTTRRSQESEFSSEDMNVSYDETTATKISLRENTATVDGKNASVDGSTIKISGEGTYIISGDLDEGQIIIEAGDQDKVQIVLNGVNLISKNKPSIYIKSCDKTFITTAKGSTNILKSSGAFTADSDTNLDATIFSKSDLVLNGNGKLEVSAESGNAVSSKDDLKVVSGEYTLKSSKHGLEGKDNVKIANATINIESGEDGIHSENEEDEKKGYVYILSGNITISSGDDGIHTIKDLTVDGGNIKITKSVEGLEGQQVNIYGGNIDIISSDDGVNATSSTDTITSDDISNNDTKNNNEKTQENGDSIDTEGAGEQRPEPHQEFNKSDRNKNITDQGKSIEGQLHKDSDQKQQGFGKSSGGKRGNMGRGSMENDENASINIYGGKMTVVAGGDGLDSNGSLNVSGGEVYVSGDTSGGNGALDYNGDAKISGGVLIAAGSSGMAQNFGTSSTQVSMLVNISGSKGEEIKVKDSSGGIVASYTPSNDFSTAVISSPKLRKGETYTVQVGDETKAITLSNTIYSEQGNGRGGGLR